MAVDQRHVEEFVSEMAMSFNVRSYSGRGMYGDTCVAITVDHGQSMGDALAAVFNLGADLGGVDDPGEEDGNLIRGIATILQSARTDSMGTGSVIYFPAASTEGVCMPDEDDDEDEDDGTDWTED